MTDRQTDRHTHTDTQTDERELKSPNFLRKVGGQKIGNIRNNHEGYPMQL